MGKTKAELEARRNTEMVLLARGYSWNAIREILELTESEYENDREIVSKRLDLNQHINLQEDYFWFRNMALQVIEDLQREIDSGEASVSSRIAGLRMKYEVAKELFNLTLQLSQLRDSYKVAKIEENDYVDRETLLRRIAEHLQLQSGRTRGET